MEKVKLTVMQPGSASPEPPAEAAAHGVQQELELARSWANSCCWLRGLPLMAAAACTLLLTTVADSCLICGPGATNLDKPVA